MGIRLMMVLAHGASFTFMKQGSQQANSTLDYLSHDTGGDGLLLDGTQRGVSNQDKFPDNLS
jgi:hypothetical protein